MNLVGDPMLAEEAFEFGLVNRVVEDHELLDTALAWARKLAGQAPLAVEQIKRVSGAGDLDAGIEAEKRAFAAAFASEDAQGGHRRLPRQTRAALQGQLSAVGRATRSRARAGRDGHAARALRLRGADRARGRLGRRADRRRHLGAVGHPRLPLAGHRAVGARRPDGGRAHRRLPHATRCASGASTASASRRSATSSPTAPTRARRARARRAARRRDHPEHRHAPPPAGTRELVEVHGSIASCSCLSLRRRVPLEEARERLAADARGRAALRALRRRR